MWHSYKTIKEFEDRFYHQLERRIIEISKGIPGKTIAMNELVEGTPNLSEDAKEILKGASEGNGNISRFLTQDGYCISSGSFSIDTKDHRQMAYWKAQVDELIAEGFLEEISKNLLVMTDKAYLYLNNE